MIELVVTLLFFNGLLLFSVIELTFPSSIIAPEFSSFSNGSIVPVYAGLSTVGASSYPDVPIGSLYSGTSITSGESMFTPPSYSRTDTVGASSEPTVDRGPVYSGTSVTTEEAEFTPRR